MASWKPIFVLVLTFICGIMTVPRSAEAQSFDVDVRPETVDVELYGETLSMCSLSTCKGRCEENRPPVFGNCFCDFDCLIHRDCCYDFAKYCHNSKEGVMEADYETNMTNDQGMNSLRQEMKYSYGNSFLNSKCTLLSEHYPLAYYLFSECHFWTSVHDENRIKCLTSTSGSREVGLDPPLFEGDVFYSSRPCAACYSGYTDEAVVPTARFVCNNTKTYKRAISVFQSQLYSDFEKFLLDKCVLFYVTPVEPNLHLKCIVGEVNSCHRTSFDGPPNEFERLEKLCQQYSSQVKSLNGTVYRNPHCALCNGVTKTTCNDYGPSQIGPPMFTNMSTVDILIEPIDTGRRPQVRVGGYSYCRHDEFLNVADDFCIANECPLGHMLLDNVCVKLDFADLKPVINTNTLHGAVLQYKLLQDVDPESLTRKTIQIIDHLNPGMPRGCIADITNDKECRFAFKTLGLDGLKTNNINSPCVVVWLLDDSSCGFNVSYPFPKTTRLIWLRALETAVSANADTIERLTFYHLAYKPVPIEKALCPGRELVLETDVAFARVAEFQTDLVTHVWSNQSKLMTPFAETPMAIGWEVTPSQSALLPQARLICLPEKLDCDRVILPDSDVTIEGSTVRVNSSGVLLERGQYVRVGDAIVLCAWALENSKTGLGDNVNEVSSAEKSQEKRESILSLASSILSPMFLLITILTYVFLKSMRTVPGFCILNMSICLILAQILFQIKPLFSRWQHLCSAVAAAQHFLWLVAFMWMNVMSFSSYRAFSNIKKGPYKQSPWLYFVYSWLVPLVFVGLCLLVDNYSPFSFSYSGNLCWLDNDLGTIVLFAVPLLVIMLANFIYFVLTAVKMKKAMYLESASSWLKLEKTRYVIYVQLSMIMGLTWFFWFLDTFSKIDYIWYVFIILNTSLGIFIFVSSVCTRPVWGDCRKFIARKAATPSARPSATSMNTPDDVSHYFSNETQKSECRVNEISEVDLDNASIDSSAVTKD